MRTPKPTREQQLLFDLLKGVVPSSLDGIDTSKLFDLFRRHRLFPMAHLLMPLLEEGERERWGKAIYMRTLRTLEIVGQLKESIDKLKSDGIEVIPLKGPILAQSLYGDINQRHMRDLDLLVEPEHFRRAVQVLEKSGYSLKFPGKDLTERKWKFYLRHQYDVALIHNERRTILELHSRIAYPGLLDGLEHLITGEKETMEISGISVRCLSREASFLYLVIHGAHHLFFRLFWLRDIAEILNRWPLDHDRVADLAVEMGIQRMLGVGLKLSNSFFGTPVPATYEKLLLDHRYYLNRMEVRCRRAIFDPQFLTKKNRFNVLLFSLVMKQGLRHKWRTISSVFYRWYLRKFLVR